MTIGGINKKVSGGIGSVGGECHLGRSVAEKWRREFIDNEPR